MDMNLGKFQKMVKDREAGVLQSMGSQTQTRLSDCTTTTTMIFSGLDSALGNRQTIAGIIDTERYQHGRGEERHPQPPGMTALSGSIGESS